MRRFAAAVFLTIIGPAAAQGPAPVHSLAADEARGVVGPRHGRHLIEALPEPGR